MQSILKVVSKRITPSKAEEECTLHLSEKILKTINDIAKHHKAKALLVGSVAKRTWVAGRNEIDVFILFNPNEPRKILETKGLDIGKQTIKKLKGKFEIAYAEHPYIRGTIGNFSIDIVPCYNIANPSKIQSAVDRTPHHVRYVQETLTQHNDVRLLKQFCVAAGCYGADVKTQGFSGYLCELLILSHGSFEKLLHSASQWRPVTKITIERADSSAVSKMSAPLIVIDPVDPKRNVAAAVSTESFFRFVSACQNFISKPTTKAFFPIEIKPYTVHDTLKEIEKRETRWYMLTFRKPKIVDDILYPQLRRAVAIMEKLLHSNGFRVLRKDFLVNDNCSLIFEMEIWQVPKIMKHVGPNIYSRHAGEFLKHYKEYRLYTENSDWTVEREREFTTTGKLFESLLRKNEKQLLEIGIPTKIAPEFKIAKLVRGADFLKYVSKSNDDFRVFMRKWFERDIEVSYK